MDKVKIVDKPWGKEIWFAYSNKKYAGKILEIKNGRRLSMQFHNKKEESYYIYEGKLKIEFGKQLKYLKVKTLKKGDNFHIPPKTIHRVKALKDSKIFEVSTPHLDDVVRIHDDYNRAGINGK